MRKSIYLTSNKFKGEILSKKDLGFRSPGDGIPPNKIEKIIGKKLKKNKFKNDLLSLNDF